jgi:hypothetical protein
MGMSPAGLRTKNDCSVEGQQQFAWLAYQGRKERRKKKYDQDKGTEKINDFACHLLAMQWY